YGLEGETNQSAANARVTDVAGTGSWPSPKSFARAEPITFPWLRGSGIGIDPSGRVWTAAAPFPFGPAAGPSLMRASRLLAIFALPVRTARVLPKNAARPQKSCCFQVGTTGWTWHSAHWSC